ncbi:ATP-binding protein [Nakamurella sp. A5-74]|uniref:histidine kinase n=1 Tax=Nakamurella sp. A5-74 TaxID=3158264 RepID=A0AAU8DTM8_9ACTN
MTRSVTGTQQESPRRPARRRSSLVRQLLLVQVLSVLITVGGLAALGTWGAAQLELAAAGRLTASIASSVAVDPQVVTAFAGPTNVRSRSAVLQPLAERIRIATGSSFIVVMSPLGIRYSHPDRSRIGLPYQGSIAAAAAGGTLTEEFVGTLGPSVRTVVPVVRDGSVVGLVSVGVLQTTIRELAARYLPLILAAAALGMLLGGLIALGLARWLRRQTLGLEPEEIAAAYLHHDAVLHDVGEGLLVLDGAGRAVVVNEEARRLLDLPDSAPQPVHRSRRVFQAKGARAFDPAVSELPGLDPAVRAVLQRGRTDDLVDEPVPSGERVLLVTVRAAEREAGPGVRIFSFRDRTELTEAIRARDDAVDRARTLAIRTHEFGNRMQTVLALVHLGDSAEAIRTGRAALHRTRGPEMAIAAEVRDPVLAALLADKAAQAAEIGVRVTVTDRLDALGDGLLPFAPDDLVSLVGNLVDNAVEAVLAVPDGLRTVHMQLDLSDDVVQIRVRDTGAGVPEDLAEELFEFGFSTRIDPSGRERGIGLALIRRISRRLGGDVRVQVPQLADMGSEFVLTLPLPQDPTPDRAPAPTAPVSGTGCVDPG